MTQHGLDERRDVPRPPDPTQPFATGVTLMCTLLAATLVAGLVLLATNANVSFMGYGRGMVCVPAMDLGLSQGDSASNGIFVNLKPGSWQFASQADVCARRPTLGQRTLVTLDTLPMGLVYTGMFVLFWRLIAAIRRRGVFAAGIARRLRSLAWFILAGGLLATAAQEVSRAAFVDTLLGHHSWPSAQHPAPDGWITDHVSLLNVLTINRAPFGLLIVGLGLLTLARVLRLGAQMQDDLVGTV
jgi:hypothetical protein